MNNVKYRAWDREEKRMITWDLLVETGNFWHGCYGEFVDLMQYTGTPDKNGVEICCSDIWRGPMCFGPGGMMETTVVIHDNLLDFGKQFGYGDWEKGEVIGNKYENPELIKKN